METFWQKLIEQLLLAFLPVIASLVVGLLYALIRKEWAKFKDLQPDISWALEQAASMAVKAAEQAGAAGYIAEKKEYALDVAEKYLAEKGFNIDLDLIDAAIEAAVFEELNKDKQPAEKPEVVISADTSPMTEAFTKASDAVSKLGKSQ